MLQHAIFTIPNRAEGYTTDDNARALIFTVLLTQLARIRMRIRTRTGTREVRESRIRQSRLAFPVLGIPGARLPSGKEKVPKLSRLRPPLDEKTRDRKILTVARCGLLELSWPIRKSGIEGCRRTFVRVLPPRRSGVHSPRACAYTVLGIQEYLNSYPGDRDAQQVRFVLGQRLLEMYESIHTSGLEVV